MIIGQPFLHQAGVTDGQLRLFEKYLAVLPKVENILPRRVLLLVQEQKVFPPNAVSFVTVISENDYHGEVYVEALISLVKNTNTRFRVG